ncbi:hypothetical protein B4Q04_09395 [Zobellia sp. OII3]|nr:hypothetical protein B4Q04_09395 [Zobellia sp. OII3]
MLRLKYLVRGISIHRLHENQRGKLKILGNLKVLKLSKNTITQIVFFEVSLGPVPIWLLG